MSYSHFTTFERGQLEAFHKLGRSTREIGKILKRHPSSVARELKKKHTKKTVRTVAKKHKNNMDSEENLVNQ